MYLVVALSGICIFKKRGAEIEKPKASRLQSVMGRECPHHQPTRGLGKRRKLPPEALGELSTLGQSPARKQS